VSKILIQGKAAQVAAIRTSPEFIGREKITKTIAARITGLKPAEAANLLHGMAQDGYLNEHSSQRQSRYYTVPPISAARIPWRKRSNEALGIQA
jgi:hypothetical protein